MNKEDFLNKMDYCNSAISFAEKKKAEFKEQYIKENCPFKVGDKVKVTFEREDLDVSYGYVERIQVSDDGKFLPDCAACKKDGTKHARNKLWLNLWNVKLIEKV